jgi:photosystem II stability/assembly factor-like uncharacterized protein
LAVVTILFFANGATASWNYFPAGHAFALSCATDSSGQKMLFGAARGGFWTSEDGGENWIASGLRLDPVYGLDPESFDILDPAADTVVITASSVPLPVMSHIWLTTDGGQTYRQPAHDLVVDNQKDVFLIWPHDHRVIFQSDDQGMVRRSTNFGQTWTPFVVSQTFIVAPSHIVPDVDHDSTLFLTEQFRNGYGGMMRSDDLGETWRTAIDFQGLWNENAGEVTDAARLSNGDLIATVRAGDPVWENGTVLISSDDGETWTRIEGGLPDRFQPTHVVEDRFAPGTLFLHGNQKYGLYWSQDYGQTWSRCLNGLPGNVAFINDVWQNRFAGTIYASVPGWGVYKTEDHGANWQTVTLPQLGIIGYFGAMDSTLFMRDDAYRQWRLDPGAADWQEMSYPLAADTLVLMRPVCYQSGDTLVSGLWKRNVIGSATDIFQMMYSYDNGGSWNLDPFLPFLPQQYFNLHRGPNGIRFISYDQLTLYSSEDLGRTWLQSPGPANYGMHSVVQNDSEMYAQVENWGRSEMFRTADRGQTWNNMNYPGGNFSAFTQPVFCGDWMVFTTGSHCYAWHDNLWQERGFVPDSAGLWYLINVPTSPPSLFGLGIWDNHAWLSHDTGRTWTEPPIEVPYPGQTSGFLDLRYVESQNRIWAISGVGTCYLDPAELSTTGPLHFLPAQYTVLAAYPNPFNSRTRILYDLVKESPVELKVYDLTGRLVQVLADEVQTLGRHEIAFDGSNLASGVYFVKLHTPQNDRTEKIVLLK